MVYTMNPTDLQVKRFYDGKGPLQKNIVPSPVQEALFPDNAIPAGRVGARNAAGEFELGVAENSVPFWLFRRTDRPSGGWNGPSVDTAKDLTWADGSKHQFLCYAGIEGVELATTEFDPAGTYDRDTFVAARTVANTNLTTDKLKAEKAGVIFTTGVTYGEHPVVGVVSEPIGKVGTYGNDYVTLFTLYRPPVPAASGTAFDAL